jgi:hypothetical protein
VKLSIAPRFGHIHVRGGRLLKVAHDHQVPCTTENLAEPEEFKRRGSDKWVTAKIGDFAIELVAVKTGKVIGYSYLAGDAIRLHLYRAGAPEHWFTPAQIQRADTTWLAAQATPDVSVLVGGMMGAKYGTADIVVFEILVDEPDLSAAANVFPKAYCYEPADPCPNEAHIIGRIVTRAGLRGPMTLLHFQPPRHKNEHAIGGFQNTLLIDGTPGIEVFDPWKQAADQRAEATTTSPPP